MYDQNNSDNASEILIPCDTFILIYKVLKLQTQNFVLNLKKQLDKYCKYSSLSVYYSSYNLKEDYNGRPSDPDLEYGYYFFCFNFSGRQKLKYHVSKLNVVSPKYYIYKNNNVNFVYPFLLEETNSNIDNFLSSIDPNKITKLDSYKIDEDTKENYLENHFFRICGLETMNNVYRYIYDNNLVYNADILFSKFKTMYYFNLKINEQGFLPEPVSEPLFLEELNNILKQKEEISIKSIEQDNSLNISSKELSEESIHSFLFLISTQYKPFRTFNS